MGGMGVRWQTQSLLVLLILLVMIMLFLLIQRRRCYLWRRRLFVLNVSWSDYPRQDLLWFWDQRQISWKTSWTWWGSRQCSQRRGTKRITRMQRNNEPLWKRYSRRLYMVLLRILMQTQPRLHWRRINNQNN